MTRHYLYGCPWADGEKQQADTDQRTNWDEVTCEQCLRLRSRGYGQDRRAERIPMDTAAQRSVFRVMSAAKCGLSLNGLCKRLSGYTEFEVKEAFWALAAGGHLRLNDKRSRILRNRS